MNIIERTYSLNGGLSNRNTTNRIILHHAAVSNCSANDVDRWHKNKGWTCIGYHFFVRKDGVIYRGRREEAVGAHAYGSNTDSIGICAEGNFENETMGDVQKQALKELVAYLKNKYGITKVQRHRDVNATACPGKNYPYNEIVNGIINQTPIDNNSFVKQVQQAVGAVVDGIVGKETLSKVPTISKNRNSKHSVVRIVQSHLINLGYSMPKYGADGIFGSETETAVKQFQKDKGLTSDGIIGHATWRKLLA